MKRCRDCEIEKPSSDFYRKKRSKDGLNSYCIPCHKVRMAKWRAENPHKAAEYRERFRQRWPERHRIASRNWYYANRDYALARDKARWWSLPPEERKRRTRASLLSSRFGMTIADYDQLLAEQGGVCAICGAPPDDDRSLCVDHCHDTETVRGLLCMACNLGIGKLGDDPARVATAALYLMEAA